MMERYIEVPDVLCRGIDIKEMNGNIALSDNFRFYDDDQVPFPQLRVTMRPLRIISNSSLS